MWQLLRELPEKAPEQRVVFYTTLEELIDEGKRVIVLEADLGGASGSTRIRKSHPERYVECGIMEANMIGVAAGLSMRGFVPFAHTFAPFASRRIADQLFLEGAYAHNTMNIYASDPGVCAAQNGGTHTTFEDISIMRAIPGVEVFDPADGVQLKWLVRELADRKGVHYIRTTRKNIMPVYAEGSTFEIGKGNVIRNGSDVLLISMGTVLEDTLRAADQLSAQGVSAEVIDMFTVKPLDRDLILQEMAGKRLIVTCENHSVIGGLGGSVAEVLTETDKHPPLRRVGVQDRFGQVGSLQYLKQDYCLTAETIVKTVKDYLAK